MGVEHDFDVDLVAVLGSMQDARPGSTMIRACSAWLRVAIGNGADVHEVEPHVRQREVLGIDRIIHGLDLFIGEGILQVSLEEIPAVGAHDHIVAIFILGSDQSIQPEVARISPRSSLPRLPQSPQGTRRGPQPGKSRSDQEGQCQ